MYLFLGYLDGATQFAQSCGGGSDTSLPWGRKEDDDDRCFCLPLHDAGSQNDENDSAKMKCRRRMINIFRLFNLIAKHSRDFINFVNADRPKPRLRGRGWEANT